MTIFWISRCKEWKILSLLILLNRKERVKFLCLLHYHLLLLESTCQWLSVMFLEIWGSESQDEKETRSLLCKHNYSNAEGLSPKMQLVVSLVFWSRWLWASPEFTICCSNQPAVWDNLLHWNYSEICLPSWLQENQFKPSYLWWKWFMGLRCLLCQWVSTWILTCTYSSQEVLVEM